MKGTLDDDVTEADIISCVEFNQDGELLATGDKGGRVVIFQVKLSKKSVNNLPKKTFRGMQLPRAVSHAGESTTSTPPFSHMNLSLTT